MEQQHTTVALEEPVGQGLLDGAASLFGGWGATHHRRFGGASGPGTIGWRCIPIRRVGGYVTMMMDGGADSV